MTAGVAGGLFGIGGSIVMIPALTWLLGPDQHLYQAAAMIVNFFLVLPALVQHRRAKAIQGRLIRKLIPLALAAIVAGVALSEAPVFQGKGEAALRLLFGLFVMSCAGVEVLRLVRPPGRPSPGETAPGASGAFDREGGGALNWPQAASIALPTGLIAGLLGVGGGVVAVPLQRRWLGLPLNIAVANSTATIASTAFVGAIVKNWALYVRHDAHTYSPFILAAMLTIPAMLGSYFAAPWTHRLPRARLMMLFIVLLVYVSARMIYDAALALR